MKTSDVKAFFQNHPSFTWGLVVFFLPPVGIFGVWKYTRWYKWVKILVSVYAGLWTLAAFTTNNAENNQPTAQIEEPSPSPSPIERDELEAEPVKIEAEKFKEEVLIEIKGWGARDVASKESPEKLLEKGRSTCEAINAGLPPEEIAEYASRQVPPDIRKVMRDYSAGLATAAKYHLC